MGALRELERHTTSNMPKRKALNVHDAVKLVKQSAWAKFDETIELSVNLNLDPRKPNQAVKGVAKLPSGTGKTVRVGVFAVGKDADIAFWKLEQILWGSEDVLKFREVRFRSTRSLQRRR